MLFIAYTIPVCKDIMSFFMASSIFAPFLTSKLAISALPNDVVLNRMYLLLISIIKLILFSKEMGYFDAPDQSAEFSAVHVCEPVPCTAFTCIKFIMQTGVNC